MDTFGFLLGTLLSSLVLLIFSINNYLSDIAFIGALLSTALLTVDDWLDDLFLNLFHLITALKKHHIDQPSSFAFSRHRPQPIKARQRWPNEHRIRRFADRGHNRHAI
jgi:hypothetical protein